MNMYGRWRLWYDYDYKTYFFATRWDEQHEQKRTVTDKEAFELQRILMGGFIREPL